VLAIGFPRLPRMLTFILALGAVNIQSRLMVTGIKSLACLTADP
jgi:hypothetical protein